ncbi:hypothetical protein BCR44DRAFT_1433574 [Catenaria anguillulae PL171]|uniref:Transmembrane protein n=1 Tax=Catenaria anguillulae PL171 TaxID=765915 RepID=A0A1Y2HMF6_9FUNG|nr:hypothetical protein BCR44DRAFT_1433574 [Catenaria anguillulae PL171]
MRVVDVARGEWMVCGRRRPMDGKRVQQAMADFPTSPFVYLGFPSIYCRLIQKSLFLMMVPIVQMPPLLLLLTCYFLRIFLSFFTRMYFVCFVLIFLSWPPLVGFMQSPNSSVHKSIIICLSIR